MARNRAKFEGMDELGYNTQEVKLVDNSVAYSQQAYRERKRHFAESSEVVTRKMTNEERKKYGLPTLGDATGEETEQ